MSARPWRPRVSGIAGFLFGPLAGGIVAYLNLKRLQNPSKAQAVLALTLLACLSFVIANGFLREDQGVAMGSAISLVCAFIFPFVQRPDCKLWQSSHADQKPAHGLRTIPWIMAGACAYILMFVVTDAILFSSKELRSLALIYYQYTENNEKVIAEADLLLSDPETPEEMRPDIQALRGTAYYREGNHENAINDFDEAIAHDPNNVSCYILRAETRKKIEGYASVYEDYITIVRLDPNNSIFLTKLGWTTCVVHGNLSEELRYLDKSIARLFLGQISPEAVMHMAQVERPLKTEGNLCEAYYFIAQYYLMMGQHEKYADYILKTLDMNKPYFFHAQAAKLEYENMTKQSSE